MYCRQYLNSESNARIVGGHDVDFRSVKSSLIGRQYRDIVIVWIRGVSKVVERWSVVRCHRLDALAVA